MADPFRVRLALRDATADLHTRVDQAFSQADLTTRDGYGRVLTAQAAAHDAVERALDLGGAAEVLADWPKRRRSALLHSDLRELGIVPPVSLPSPPFEGMAALLGGIYVLEGSRLGGALLKRSVPADLPRAFLGAADSAAWRSLLQTLDQRIVNNDELQRAIDAARQAFLLFERSGRQFLKAD